MGRQGEGEDNNNKGFGKRAEWNIALLGQPGVWESCNFFSIYFGLFLLMLLMMLLLLLFVVVVVVVAVVVVCCCFYWL